MLGKATQHWIAASYPGGHTTTKGNDYYENHVYRRHSFVL
jgi:hypothetical protein